MTFVQRTDWKDDPAGATPVMAADLLRIEQGIAANTTAVATNTTSIASKVTGTAVTELRILTQAAYDAIGAKSSTTVYVIVG